MAKTLEEVKKEYPGKEVEIWEAKTKFIVYQHYGFLVLDENGKPLKGFVGGET